MIWDMNNYYSNFFDDCSVLLEPECLTEKERKVAEKIDKAKDSQEIAIIISEALVSSLMEQLEVIAPVTETVSNSSDDDVCKPQKKLRNRHSKEGYMTEQQWQDYFDARDKGGLIPPNTHILGSEEDFIQIHSSRSIKEA